MQCSGCKAKKALIYINRLSGRARKLLISGSDAMPDQTTEAIHSAPTHSIPALSLAALGVVFGDIGTSPLYTLKTVLDVTGKQPEPAAILGR